MDSGKRIKRLMEVASLYYEADETQSEIARRYGISRPMVSRLLKEAKETGIVKISIQPPASAQEVLLARMKGEFKLKGGVLVADGGSDTAVNDALAAAAVDFLKGIRGASLGVGWGHIIGNFVRHMERAEHLEPVCKTICPLIGNGGVGLKNYHSNELVRVIAEHSGAAPEFLYSPAYVLSEQELNLTKELDNYRLVYEAWRKLDVALVNIGNFPSVPDFASEARYGDVLVKQKAVGRILNYFVNREGRVLYSDTDYAIQIPLELLRRTKHVVGICSANISQTALRGVLRTGLVNYLIAPVRVVETALKEEML